MATIILAGWRGGLQKVALAHLQRELLHLPIKEAKENVDRLLEAAENEALAKPVVLQVPDEVATEFFSRANDLGVHLKFSVANMHNSTAATPEAANRQKAA